MKLNLRLLNVKDLLACDDISDHGVLFEHAQLSDGNHLAGLLSFGDLFLKDVSLDVDQLLHVWVLTRLYAIDFKFYFVRCRVLS